ncbi:VOC family protein [Cryptosporangium sp. NPDC048952]|uniref:VOC family protein n=1 Tax=Cryptosporangium sp. NPDC048952 TaxID=3363961 RepID=UPI00371EB607
MADEVTVPLLPCSSIDDIETFYVALGFRTTYKQRKPNPHVVVEREAIGLHFFEIAGFDPEQSYGSCLVVTPDVEGLHRAFAAGMRATYGKVLVSGLPRMTRARPRKNYGGVTGFSVIDPGGNWIRVVHRTSPGSAPDAERQPRAANVAGGRLTTALANAVVQADSRGDTAQAVRILDTALARPDATDDPVALVELLAYRAELALVLGDSATASALFNRVAAVSLTPEERERAATALENAADLVQPDSPPPTSAG